MKAYRYPGILFRKEWHWFETPRDMEGVDMLNFFSYDDVDKEGFKRKMGITSVIDLKLSEDALWEGMRKKYVREQLEKGRKNGIRVDANIAWEKLISVYQRFRKGKDIARDDPRVFQHCRVYGAYLGDELLAMGAFVEDKKHTRALVLASDRFSHDGKRRELIGQANRMLIWEAMKDARLRGIEQFDLGGLAPDSPSPGDRSLAEFKEAFGGERRACYYYSKVNSPLLKLLIRTRRLLHI